MQQPIITDVIQKDFVLCGFSSPFVDLNLVNTNDMDNSWKNNIVHEHSIYSLQQRARNITTWQAYPIPGRLVEVP